MLMVIIISICLSQVFIQGLVNLNRAVHEDVVAVEILPKGQWTCPSSVVTTTSTENKNDDDDDDSNDDDDLKVRILYFIFHKFPRFETPN